MDQQAVSKAEAGLSAWVPTWWECAAAGRAVRFVTFLAGFYHFLSYGRITCLVRRVHLLLLLNCDRFRWQWSTLSQDTDLRNLCPAGRTMNWALCFVSTASGRSCGSLVSVTERQWHTGGHGEAVPDESAFCRRNAAYTGRWHVW